MNNKSMNRTKKEDKKTFIKFLITIIISAVIGGFVGFMSVKLKKTLGDNLSVLTINMLEIITPFASLILSVLVIIVGKIIYTNSRKEYELWKQANEDDDSIDKTEENLAYLLLFSSVNTIIGMFFFGVGAKILIFDNIHGEISTLKVISFVLGFILCLISAIVIQKKVVNLEKEINPLLKGDTYDKDFTKQWVDSCDESIKLEIYKSAYKAYLSVSRTCIILWILCILGFILWDLGIMPIVIVTIIWLVQTISYCMESIKISKIK